jgi:hypothetical protein
MMRRGLMRVADDLWDALALEARLPPATPSGKVTCPVTVYGLCPLDLKRER